MTHQSVLSAAKRHRVEITEGREKRSEPDPEHTNKHQQDVFTALYVHVIVPGGTHHSFSVCQHQTGGESLRGELRFRNRHDLKQRIKCVMKKDLYHIRKRHAPLEILQLSGEHFQSGV